MNKMKDLSKKILDLLEELEDKEALEVLAEVVTEYDLDVAANLIRENHEPSLTKGCFEEYLYGEGNEDAGHLPLAAILKEVEEVINCDTTERDITFTPCLVRHYTQEELQEEGKENDGIEWYKHDEEKKTGDILIGFDAN